MTCVCVSFHWTVVILSAAFTVFCLVGCDICPEKAEEGKSAAIWFTVPDNVFATSVFKWRSDTLQDQDLVTCNATEGSCETSGGYEQSLSGTVSFPGNSMRLDLVISEVNRSTDEFNMETTWRVYDNDTNTELFSCDLLVYARPSGLTCDSPQFTSNDSSLSLSCHADRIYPRAKCQFFWKATIKGSRHSLDNIGVEYEQPYRPDPDPVYYASTCTATVPLSRLRKGTKYFSVDMYPEFNGSTPDHGSVNPGNPNISLSYPTVTIRTGRQCPMVSGSNNYENDYIKSGASFSCLCSLANAGKPRGRVQWLDHSGNVLAEGGGRLQVQSATQGQTFTCRGISPLGSHSGFDKDYKPKIAYGPKKKPVVSLVSGGDAPLFICPLGNLTIPIVCQTPVDDVMPAPSGLIQLKKSGVNKTQEHINGSRVRQEHGRYKFYSDLTVTEAGNYSAVCTAFNSLFQDFAEVDTIRVTVEEDAADAKAPLFLVNDTQIAENEIVAGDDVIVTCAETGPETKLTGLTCRREDAEVIRSNHDIISFLPADVADNGTVCVCEYTVPSRECTVRKTKVLTVMGECLRRE